MYAHKLVAVLQVDAVVPMGVLIKGDTDHYDMIKDAATAALMDLQVLPYCHSWIPGLPAARRRLGREFQVSREMMSSRWMQGLAVKPASGCWVLCILRRSPESGSRRFAAATAAPARTLWRLRKAAAGESNALDAGMRKGVGLTVGQRERWCLAAAGDTIR